MDSTPHWWDPRWTRENRVAAPARFPIHELPNVVVTPHVAGSTDQPSHRTIEIVAENIWRTFRGKPPINQVDRELQY